MTRFAYAVAGDRRGARTRAVISSLGIALLACAGLPCQPASYYAPEARVPYRAVEVQMRAPAGHTLVATLTLPKRAAGPVPAIFPGLQVAGAVVGG